MQNRSVRRDRIDHGSTWRGEMKRLVLALAMALAFSAACGDDGDIGDACEEAGRTDDCVDGAICTNVDGSNENVCRKICEDQADCAQGESCNGVRDTNIKSCQPE
jgi:hypothetical protein